MMELFPAIAPLEREGDCGFLLSVVSTRELLERRFSIPSSLPRRMIQPTKPTGLTPSLNQFHSGTVLPRLSRFPTRRREASLKDQRTEASVGRATTAARSNITTSRGLAPRGKKTDTVHPTWLQKHLHNPN